MKVRKASAVAALTIAISTAGAVSAPTSAWASSGPASLKTARPADAPATCTGGSYLGSASADTSNGHLSITACRYTAGGIATVNIQYQKKAGSDATVRFGWEWVNYSGSNATGRRLDQGAFVIKSGQTRGFTWSYSSPGVYSPSGNNSCIHGVLIQGSDVFSTRTICTSVGLTSSKTPATPIPTKSNH